jgi:type VI secretion system protein
MALTLHVTSYNNHSPTTELSVTVNETGCTIGRAASNGFVLPDVERIISHRHASIQFKDGSYYLTDNSINGTFINHAAEPVGQDNKILLHDGDILTIGKYDCAISIAALEKPAANSLLDNAMWQPPPGPAAEEKIPDLIPGPYPEPVLPIPPQSNAAPGPGSSPASDPAVEQEYFRPPEAIREDWDELTGLMREVKIEDADIISEPVTPQAIPEPVTPQAIPEPVTPEAIHEPVTPETIPELVTEQQTPAPHTLSATDEKRAVTPVSKQHGDDRETAILNQQLVDAFLAGTGLTEVNLEPEEMINFMLTAGQSLRELTQGFKQVLSTRSSLKNEFRLGVTMMQPAENNPLKLSLDVEDALTKLLLPSSRGFLPPIEAIQEATDDLQAHQMALLAGLRAALSSLVALFDPEALEKDLQKASTFDNLLPSIRKARYWELFKTNYRTAAADAENDFLHFLGDEFSTAYEQQIQRLESIRHKNNQ